jgi:hypothetical protein
LELAGLKRRRFLIQSPKSGTPMTHQAQARGVSAVASAGARLLDLLAAGKSIARIAEDRNHTRARVEKLLRAELRAIAIRPIRDYAKIQIRRLDAIVDRLTELANGGDLAAIDRLLKVLDRLDRYHGFSTRAAPAAEYQGISQELLLAKIERAAEHRNAARRAA